MEEVKSHRVVSYPLACKLKEVKYTTYDFIGLYKGDTYFGPESEEGLDFDNFNLKEYECLAPLHLDVQEWLRSVHGLEVRLLWEWTNAGTSDRLTIKSIINGPGVQVTDRDSIKDMTCIGYEMDKLLVEALDYIKK